MGQFLMGALVFFAGLIVGMVIVQTTIKQYLDNNKDDNGV